MSTTYRSHPDEVGALMREDAARIPNFPCFGCGRDTAYYLRKDNHWYPARYECSCGWWLPERDYERRVEEILGLNEEGEEAA